MSLYFVKKKGWRYDFTLKGSRYTEAWFKTKVAARQAESRRRQELKSPVSMVQTNPTQIDMDFLTLCNKRLDHVKAYNTEEHFRHVLYHIKRWIKEWNGFYCSEITSEMIENFAKERKEVSPDTANKEIRYLRATFNFGIKQEYILSNPANKVDFFPVTKRKKYVPPKEDVYKVIRAANPDEQDYLLSIVLTAARMNEINSLKWEDVDFNKKEITLWTRKKKGGIVSQEKYTWYPNSTTFL